MGLRRAGGQTGRERASEFKRWLHLPAFPPPPGRGREQLWVAARSCGADGQRGRQGRAWSSKKMRGCSGRSQLTTCAKDEGGARASDMITSGGSGWRPGPQERGRLCEGMTRHEIDSAMATQRLSGSSSRSAAQPLGRSRRGREGMALRALGAGGTIRRKRTVPRQMRLLRDYLNQGRRLVFYR